MSDLNQIHNENINKINSINQLIKQLSSRTSISYSEYNPRLNPTVTLQELIELNDQKETEIKTIQNAWEQLEHLLLGDLQITVQEKKQLFDFLGYKKKQDKKKQSETNTHIWRKDDRQ